MCRLVTPIAHLDVDAFYASVELLRRPELRGLPVIVSGSGPRAVVTTASYEARRFGVGSAMPTARARRLCPDAVLDPAGLRRLPRGVARVMELVRAAPSSASRVLGLDEAYLDLSGLVAPRAAMRRLVTDVHAATGLDVLDRDRTEPARREGRLGRREAARASSASRASRRASASPATRPAWCPGSARRPPRGWRALGITTLGALRGDAGGRARRRRFGANHGPDLRGARRFDGSAVLDAGARSRSPSRARRRSTPTSATAPSSRRCSRDLAGQLCERLAAQERRGRTIAIKVRLDDWTTVTRARTIAAATNDAPIVARRRARAPARVRPARPVRLLGVRVAAFARAARAARCRPARAALVALSSCRPSTSPETTSTTSAAEPASRCCSSRAWGETACIGAKASCAGWRPASS